MSLSRRSALVLQLAAALPGRARAAMPPITDAIGRVVTLRAPPERVVIGFNFEEFTAVAGSAGWDRVVGFNRRQWAVNRQSNWHRYQAAIPRLSGLADIGASENNTFSVERVLGLRPDLLITLALDYNGMQPAMAQIEAAGVPILVVDYSAQVVGKPLPSIRSGELHAIETGLARSLWDWTATQYIAKQMHPDRFSDVDPVTELRRYHERFLPVPFEGAWMVRSTA